MMLEKIIFCFLFFIRYGFANVVTIIFISYILIIAVCTKVVRSNVLPFHLQLLTYQKRNKSHRQQSEACGH